MNSLIDGVHINFDTQSLWILNLILGVVMFGIALEISWKDFKFLVYRPKPVIIGVISQFVLLPVVTFILVWLIKPVPSIALGMIMVAACPGGNISNFITHLAKGNAALSVSLTGIATLLAIIMTPLNLEIWGGFYPPTANILKEVSISPWQMVRLVALLLGVPLVAGIWTNHKWPALAKKMGKILKVVSLLFFILLVFIALYNNRSIFANYIVYVFWIVLLHNFVAYATGFSLAKAVGLSPENVKAVTIETGIQNSGLGLLLIFTFFDGLGGMALLTAFWGVWHLVSGLLLAWFWGKKSLLIKKEKLS